MYIGDLDVGIDGDVIVCITLNLLLALIIDNFLACCCILFPTPIRDRYITRKNVWWGNTYAGAGVDTYLYLLPTLIIICVVDP